MEAVLLIGVQASGKSTFYVERFSATHVRINLDMLKTRHRERQFLETCLRTGQRFVVDNTNPTRTERQSYIQTAKVARFRIVGYYFQSTVVDCLRRNGERSLSQQIPIQGLLATYAKLELPTQDEGFDEMFYVKFAKDGFAVEEWRHEV